MKHDVGRVLSLVIAGCSAVALFATAGCKSDSGTGSGGSGETSTPTPAPTPTPTPPSANMPPLPLSVGARVMAFCDSHSSFNNFVADNALSSTEKGLLEAAWQSDPRFNFDSWYDPAAAVQNGIYGSRLTGANQGIDGEHLDGAVARLASIVAHAPEVAVVNCGTNSISSGDGGSAPASASYVTSQLDRIIESFASNGAWVILSTLYPRGDWPVGDARHQTVRDVNAWIRQQTGRQGVAAVLDPYDDLAKPDGDGVRPELFAEGESGVHLNPAGVHLVKTKYLTPAIDQVIASGTVFNQSPTTDNLLPASTYSLAGTNGQRSGTQTAGQVATGWQLGMTRAGGGSTQVASKDDTDANLAKQVITVSPGSTAAWDQTLLTFPRLALTPQQAAPGAWVRAYVLVDAAENAPTAHWSLTATLADSSGTMTLQAIAGQLESPQFNSAELGQYPNPGRGTYWLATKPFRLPDDGNYATLSLSVTGNFWTGGFQPGSSFRVAFSRPIVRLSDDPQPAWQR